MAYNGANTQEVIEIVMRTKLDQDALRKQLQIASNEASKIQDNISRQEERITRFMEQHARSTSNYHKQEMDSRNTVIAAEERKLKLLASQLELIQAQGSAYKMLASNPLAGLFGGDPKKEVAERERLAKQELAERERLAKQHQSIVRNSTRYEQAEAQETTKKVKEELAIRELQQRIYLQRLKKSEMLFQRGIQKDIATAINNTSGFKGFSQKADRIADEIANQKSYNAGILAEERKLALEKERLYQKVNQNMLEQAQLASAKRSDLAAKARRDEIDAENRLLQEKLRILKKQEALYKDHYAGRATSINQPIAGFKDTAGRKVYGDYSDLASGNTLKADPGKVWQNTQANATRAASVVSSEADKMARAHTKAANEAHRAWSKTFMGAIEGGTTFGHKVATTFQYMAAGTGIAAVAASLGAMTTAFLEADKAMHMFKGVLELSNSQANKLQESIYSIGITYGGTTDELNNAALALGRAGIEGDKLAGSLQAVSQLSLISGESMDTVTGVLVSWQSLYPTKSIGELGDVIVKMANDTKASVADFAVMSTYILTAGQQAGVTVEALGALAASMRQIGKGSSTSGTELRRFFNQLSTGSEDVRHAFSSMGIDVRQLSIDMAKGGEKSNEALSQFFNTLKTADTSGIEQIGQVLDKATLKSLLAIAKASKDGKPLFDALMLSAQKAQGASAKAADEVALSYTVMGERAKVAIGYIANEAGKALTSSAFGEVTNGTFSKYLEELTSGTSIFMKVLLTAADIFGSLIKIAIDFGDVIGNVLGVVSDTFSTMFNYIQFGLQALFTGVVGDTSKAGDAMIEGFGFFEFVSLGITTAQAGIQDFFSGIMVAGGYLSKLLAKLSGDKSWEAAADTQIDAYLKKMDGSIDTILNKYDELKARTKAGPHKLDFTTTPLPTPPGPGGGGGGDTNSDTDEERDARNLAKDALESARASLALKEQEHFIAKGITDEAAKKWYHVNKTLKAELALVSNASVGKTGAFRNEEDKQVDIKKVATEREKAQVELNALVVQSTREMEKQVVSLNAQIGLAGMISDEERIRLTSNQKQLEIETGRDQLLKQYLDMGEEGKVLAGNLIATTELQLKLNKALTTEQERQFKIQKDAYNYSVDTASVEMEALQAVTGAEQVRLEQMKIERDLQAEILKIQEESFKLGQAGSAEEKKATDNARDRAQYAKDHVSGAETYNQLLIESNIAYERNNTIAKGLMRVTEDGLSALSDGLSGILTSSIDQSRALSDLKKQYNRDIASAKDSEEAARITQEYNKQTAAIKEQYSSKEQFKKLTREITDQVLKGLIQELVVNQMILQIRQLMGAASSGIAGAFTGIADAFTGGGGSTMAGTGFIDGTGATGGMLAAKGGVFGSDGTKYLAKGGSYVNSIVTSPTYVAKGTIAGEAGAEAVIPLQRDSQGRLGVNASGNSGGVQSVQVNIKNESGETLAVTKSESKTDMSNMVLDIWIDAVQRNKKGVRDMIRR
jgi:TP901 family phage tail tape measure protein